MAGLAEKLLGGEHRDRVVADCVQLLEGFVASRSGIKGIGMKTGLAMVKAARPDIVPRATAKLLPEFLDALDGFHTEFRSSKPAAGSFSAFLSARSDQASSALLNVADRRVDASSNKTVKGAYQRFRGGAEREVAGILPKLGEIIDRYAPAV